MSVGGIGGSSQSNIQALVDMRRQLDDLQRQLGSGKKSTTYAGFGLDRGLGVALRSQLAGLSGFSQTMTTINVRLQLAQNSLARMIELSGEAKTTVGEQGAIGASGQTVPQLSARNQLDELLELLNTQADGRYLFAGRALDAPPVAGIQTLLDGDGARAGLKQVIAERRAADLGMAGQGRLVASNAGSTVSLAEDVAGSPFGFRLTAATTDIPGATVSGPSGSPPQIDVALGANPAPGQAVTFTLALPDGTSQPLRLVATTSTPPGAGEFTIGADPTVTAANLEGALETSLGKLAGTELVAASAMAAANDFFNVDAGQNPRRVAGPPFDTATSVVSGTPTNTVFWYTGEVSVDPARSSVSARVDQSLSLNYGIRANEPGITALVKNLAVFVATTFAPGDPATGGGYTALVDRLRPALDGGPSMQKIEEISADIGAAQGMMKATSDRNQQAAGVLTSLLEDTEGVSTEEVAAKILTLQTRLQASLQTTAILYRLNLADYI